MRKLWIKNYLGLSTLIILILVSVCSTTLVVKNISSAEEKNTFESIYKDTSIDFIVPSPSYNQVLEINNDSSTGIEIMTPYYETSISVDINESKSEKGDVLLFPITSLPENTPYCSNRVILGDKEIVAGEAVVDIVYADRYDCKVGDTITITLIGQTISFRLSAITLSNTYYKNGSMALFLTDAQTDSLQNEEITYSASYVKASNYENCKDYLYNNYKPLGRLKDKSEFDSEETYNQHLIDFDKADWTQEITNCKDNYNELVIKYANCDKNILINVGIYSVIVFLIVIVMNSMFLHGESFKNFMHSYLVRKGGNIKEINSFYCWGIMYDILLFIIICTVEYIIIVKQSTLDIFGINLVNIGVPILSCIFASLIMFYVVKAYIKKNYTVTKRM